MTWRHVREHTPLEHDEQGIVHASPIDWLPGPQRRGEHVPTRSANDLQLGQDGDGLWCEMHKVCPSCLGPAGGNLLQSSIQLELVPRSVRNLALALPREDKETQCCDGNGLCVTASRVAQCSPKVRDFGDAERDIALAGSSIEVVAGEALDARRLHPLACLREAPYSLRVNEDFTRKLLGGSPAGLTLRDLLQRGYELRRVTSRIF